MRIADSAEGFFADMRAEGRIGSIHTERAYRYALTVLARDLANCDVQDISRRDLQQVLIRWPNARTRAQRHAIFTSFLDWCVHEDHIAANPARRVRPARVRPDPPTRLTLSEVHALLDVAARSPRSKLIVWTLLHTGARSQELRQLVGADLDRPGFIRFVGKGDGERWVPVADDLAPVLEDARSQISARDHLLSARGSKRRPVAASTVFRAVRRIGVEAGVAVPVGPHMLRHAFASSFIRHGGDRATQTILGHARISTTLDVYASGVTLDELAVAFDGFGYGYVRE